MEDKKSNFLNKIFSSKNEKEYKVITIFGIRFKFKSKVLFLREKFLELEKRQIEFEEKNENIVFELCHNEIYNKNIKEKFDPENLIGLIKNAPEYSFVDSTHNYLNLLLNCEEFNWHENKFNSDDALFLWEIRPRFVNQEIIYRAIKANKKTFFIGDSFLRSIDTHANDKADPKFQKGISFTIDDLTSYFDGTKMSRLEQMLNDPNYIVSNEQKERARNCIDKIIQNHLTKYNLQPIFEPNIGRKGAKKVLVVDQTYNDMSILKGCATDETFEKMLNCAIKENPDADIIIKTHPDVMTGNRSGYFSHIKPHDNIYTQTTPINPISLINYVDKVYVVSTQFGFEALMAGKEVHTFGMPFYANWGLTIDNQKCSRRTNKRSLEEIFYLAYIVYSYYVNPDTKKRCEIEEAIQYLLKLREEYFKLGEK